MSAARPPEGARAAARRAEATLIGAARPPEGARAAARRTKVRSLAKIT